LQRQEQKEKLSTIVLLALEATNDRSSVPVEVGVKTSANHIRTFVIVQALQANTEVVAPVAVAAR